MVYVTLMLGSLGGPQLHRAGDNRLLPHCSFTNWAAQTVRSEKSATTTTTTTFNFSATSTYWYSHHPPKLLQYPVKYTAMKEDRFFHSFPRWSSPT